MRIMNYNCLFSVILPLKRYMAQEQQLCLFSVNLKLKKHEESWVAYPITITWASQIADALRVGYEKNSIRSVNLWTSLPSITVQYECSLFQPSADRIFWPTACIRLSQIKDFHCSSPNSLSNWDLIVCSLAEAWENPQITSWYRLYEKYANDQWGYDALSPVSITLTDP